MKTKPLTMLLTMLAGWINRQQQEIIEYLMAENDILKGELLKATGKKRIFLNDSHGLNSILSVCVTSWDFVKPSKTATLSS